MSKKTSGDPLPEFAPTVSVSASSRYAEQGISQKKTVRDLSPPFADEEFDPSQFEDFFSAKKTLKMRTAPFEEPREREPPPSNAFRTPDEKLFRAGERVGSYIIEGIIDPGGEVARVYKARHSFADRTAALKVLLTRHAGRKDLMAKMQAEAIALSRVHHPNVVAFYDANVLDDLVWIAEEYLEGPDGRELIERNGSLPLDEALSTVYQIGAGLAAAHDQGILHLDVKLENFIFSQAGVKLVDLGTAKFLSDSGSDSARVAGTPEYMAPERFARGATPDERADIYSLALVLYELVTGRHALTQKRGLSDEHIEWLQCRMAPTMAPQFSFQLWEVVASALAKDPERRPRSVREFITRLKKAAAQVHNAPDASSVPTTVVRLWVEGSAVLGAIVGLLIGAVLFLAMPVFAPVANAAKPDVSGAARPLPLKEGTTVAPAPPAPEPLAGHSPPPAAPSSATVAPRATVTLSVAEPRPAGRAIPPASGAATPTPPGPARAALKRPPGHTSASNPAPAAPSSSAPGPGRRNLEISNDVPF